MNKLFLLLGTLPILLQPSCEDKKCKNMKFLSEIKEDYILDSCLTREFYKEYSMDISKEGIVLTPEIAVGIAQSIWIGIYGEEVVEKEKPFSVNLDDDIWIVEGTLPSSNNQVMFGGTLYIEIRKSNGEIIKVFHSK